MRTPRRSRGLLMAALGAATSAILAMAGPANATPVAASGHPSPPPQGSVKASTASGPSAATSNFEQVKLASGPDDMGEPMTLAVLPNGDVLHDSRDGTIFYTTKDGVTSVAAKVPVYNHDEEGLQGIAVDPQFTQDHWVYAYYAPVLNTPSGDAPDWGTAADWNRWHGYNQLSRFKLTSDNTIDLASEQKIMQVGPTDRGICCHVAGNIDFDNAGNLYLSTGGDTNPFASDGYSPIDDRPGRNPAYDARRSSANTNDLRGKLLRIHVHPDGSYTEPDGNLFAPGTAKTRPEIYAMGFRNPFRFTVDRKTGIVYLADYGPDAQKPDPNRGPENTIEYNRITKAGNFGWPLCVGNNTPYLHYDFATGVSGAPYDCQHPVNDSSLNTGLTDLPPAQPAWIWNHYAGNPLFPQLGGQGSPMGGPVYHYDPSLKSSTAFPSSYDGQFFAMEFGQHWIKPIQMDRNGNIQQINTLTNGQDWAHLVEPMDADFGPDGSLYVLDYGSTWFSGSADSALYKINYVGPSSAAAHTGG